MAEKNLSAKKSKKAVDKEVVALLTKPGYLNPRETSP